tara:strand:+ start:161 stop:1429 length:1269 start_codon:yes stop_codon:yes gene_type:complete
MTKGLKIRLDVYNILLSIHKFNKKLNDSSIQKIIKKHKLENISFINNVVLNSMRYQFHCRKIIAKYIKKKLTEREIILLVSAITQIVFLNFKEYAVVNCTVEISKKLNIYHGLVNAFLKNVSKEKDKLNKIQIEYSDLPLWFRDNTKDLNKGIQNKILENFYKKPNVHVVFKDEGKLESFEEYIVKTSNTSGFINKKIKLENIKSYHKGEWWIQDFSSFFPLKNFNFPKKNKKFLDICAAPGGKAFQVLSKGLEITLNDKSKKRLETLKSNLNRLKFKATILNYEAQKFDLKQKYDFIIVDSPCSSVGTIRKNPEIFFKKDEPDLKKLINTQKKILIKASELLNDNGIILYMVCSFLHAETINQIENFLSAKKNFKLAKFKVSKEKIIYSNIVKGNIMRIVPGTILNRTIDGYFAVYLEKIK